MTDRHKPAYGKRQWLKQCATECKRSSNVTTQSEWDSCKCECKLVWTDLCLPFVFCIAKEVKRSWRSFIIGYQRVPGFPPVLSKWQRHSAQTLVSMNDFPQICAHLLKQSAKRSKQVCEGHRSLINFLFKRGHEHTHTHTHWSVTSTLLFLIPWSKQSQSGRRW